MPNKKPAKKEPAKKAIKKQTKESPKEEPKIAVEVNKLKTAVIFLNQAFTANVPYSEDTVAMGNAAIAKIRGLLQQIRNCLPPNEDLGLPVPEDPNKPAPKKKARK